MASIPRYQRRGASEHAETKANIGEAVLEARVRSKGLKNVVQRASP